MTSEMLTPEVWDQGLKAARDTDESVTTFLGGVIKLTCCEDMFRDLFPNPRVWRIKGRYPDGYYRFERAAGDGPHPHVYRIAPWQFWGASMSRAGGGIPFPHRPDPPLRPRPKPDPHCGMPGCGITAECWRCRLA